MTATKALDAIALLKADHRTVEDLFARFEAATSAADKEALAVQICTELSVHARIEEDIFYPACKGVVDAELRNEALVEHDAAKLLIAEIAMGGRSDRFSDAKMMVLKEEIAHHVGEEERAGDGMFAQARKGGLDLAKLGERMAAEKTRLMADFMANGLPMPATSTLVATSIGQLVAD
ncbi:hemerythrin domain-containing protein [Sandarakinorhabdus rubra]|uniref:hemerythrin domain-containing protein n=1 Tax=Sandarakinorhabdus rubra TaxID=2672568 RepID=UPI0013DD6B8D|nr:hemerythrin domain-containing protein [Sandarakinorhabdus rubra]